MIFDHHYKPDWKPCPFCPDGGKPYAQQYGNESTKQRGVEIGCGKCHFKKRIGTIHLPLSWAWEKAEEIWNTRYSENVI